MIPRGAKTPEGSGDCGSGQTNRTEALQRDRGIDINAVRSKPEAGMESKIRTGSVDERLVAKWQARNVDPGMEAPKRAAVAGERKAVTSNRSRSETRGGVPPKH